MLMLNLNEPIKVAHLQKLANQSMLNGALVIEMVINFSVKSIKKNMARNVLIKSNKDMGSGKSTSTGFH